MPPSSGASSSTDSSPRTKNAYWKISGSVPRVGERREPARRASLTSAQLRCRARTTPARSPASTAAGVPVRRTPRSMSVTCRRCGAPARDRATPSARRCRPARVSVEQRRPRTAARAVSSRPLAGSSSSSSSGAGSIALASSTRCSSPPDSAPSGRAREAGEADPRQQRLAAPRAARGRCRSTPAGAAASGRGTRRRSAAACDRRRSAAARSRCARRRASGSGCCR